jgi:protein-L-isoaspartate(D-aspartate) O-methyltransferase
LPIGKSQTITSPYTVAYMTEQLDLQPTDKVLEIGTGSGYQAAVLSCLVANVYSVEIVEELGKRALETLTRLGYDNITTKIGDGYQGWAEHAPFDKIIVTCSPEDIPQPLVDQLKEGGRLIVPLGERYQQSMCLFCKADGKLTKQQLDATLFVPMTGQADAEREVKADPGKPAVINGDFEEVSGKQPKGWYYMRQATIESDASHGDHYLVLQNGEPGRTAMAIQAVGIDGRHAREVEVSVRCSGQQLAPGPKASQTPGFIIVFFDEQRESAGKFSMGPWKGSFNWTEQQLRIKVPRTARFASFELGLWGGTGKLLVDQVRLTVLDQRLP